MRNNVDETYNEIINLWGSKAYKGIGTVHCIEPLQYDELIARIILLMRNKNPDLKIFIVVGKWEYRNIIINKLRAIGISDDKFNIITYTYVNSNFNYNYDITIAVGVNDWNLYLSTAFNVCRFKLMIITNDNISASTLNSIYNNIPVINTSIDSESINIDRMLLPVEEHRIALQFTNKSDIEEYNNYESYITQILQVFNDFETIKAARVGTKDKSSTQVLNEIAEYNGWSNEMDMTNPFNSEIDKCYNPIVLAEKANTCYNIMRSRSTFCSDNDCKLDKIIEIIRDNPKLKFLVISKRGQFAATVTNYINSKLGEIAGDYHDNIEPRTLINGNGVPILYKSGTNKGKPRVIKSKAISSLNLKAFNDGLLRVLSIKNSSDTSLTARVDAWIITSPLCDNIDALKYRYNNINYKQPKLKVYKLYISETIEERALTKEKISANHEIIEIVNSNVIAENFSHNVC